MRNQSAVASSTQLPDRSWRFTVITLGVENVNRIYPRNHIARAIHDRATGSLADLDVPEDSVQALIRQTERREAQVVVDAREFLQDHTLDGHRGTHPAVLAGVVAHCGFRQTLSRISRVAREHMSAGVSADLVVAVFCRRGVRQSVAAGILVAHCLIDDGWVGTLVNICEDLGGSRLCGPRCPDCQDSVAAGLIACTAARAVWRGDSGGLSPPMPEASTPCGVPPPDES